MIDVTAHLRPYQRELLAEMDRCFLPGTDVCMPSRWPRRAGHTTVLVAWVVRQQMQGKVVAVFCLGRRSADTFEAAVIELGGSALIAKGGQLNAPSSNTRAQAAMRARADIIITHSMEVDMDFVLPPDLERELGQVSPDPPYRESVRVQYAQHTIQT